MRHTTSTRATRATHPPRNSSKFHPPLSAGFEFAEQQCGFCAGCCQHWTAHCILPRRFRCWLPPFRQFRLVHQVYVPYIGLSLGYIAFIAKSGCHYIYTPFPALFLLAVVRPFFATSVLARKRNSEFCPPRDVCLRKRTARSGNSQSGNQLIRLVNNTTISTTYQ